MTKIKLLHLAKFYPPEWGGMESVTQDLAIGAHDAGHEVTVIAFTNHGVAKTEVVKGVKIIRTLAKTVASQPLSATWMKHAIAQVRVADVIHIHLPNMLAATILPFVPPRTKIVLHWHSDVVGKKLLSRITRPIEHAMAKRADAIIATSEPYAMASDILKKYAAKVHVIPLGIHDPATHSGHPLPEDIDRFIAGRPVVLSVGRMVPYKGFSYLIDAMKSISMDCCVIIVGGGELEGDLHQQIIDQSLQSSVLLAGKVPLATLNGLFEKASLYVMPSILRSEAFGVVLLEAMAHRLPIIATKIEGSGVPWVNQDSVTGRNVAVTDSAALSNAIDMILADPIGMARYGNTARERFETHFSADLMTQRTLALYDRLKSL
jgi:glycosyltransferase involved in cell wall biosynthesis